MPGIEQFRTDFDPSKYFLLDGALLNKQSELLNSLQNANISDTFRETTSMNVVRTGSPPPDRQIGYVRINQAGTDCPTDPMTGYYTAPCFRHDLYGIDFVWLDGSTNVWYAYEIPSGFNPVLNARGPAQFNPSKGWGQVPGFAVGERIMAIWDHQAGYFTPINYGAEQLGSVEYMAAQHQPEPIQGGLNFGSLTAVAYFELNRRHIRGRDASLILPDPNSFLSQTNYGVGYGQNGDNYHTLHGSSIVPIKHGDVATLSFGIPRRYPQDVHAVNWGFRVIPVGRGWLPRGTPSFINWEEPYRGMKYLPNMRLAGESVNRFKDCPFSIVDDSGTKVQFRFYNTNDPMTGYYWTCLVLFWVEIRISEESTTSSSQSSQSSGTSTGSSTGSTGSSTGYSSDGSSTGSSTGSTSTGYSTESFSISESSSGFDCCKVVSNVICDNSGGVAEVCYIEICFPKGRGFVCGEETCKPCPGGPDDDSTSDGDNSSSIIDNSSTWIQNSSSWLQNSTSSSQLFSGSCSDGFGHRINCAIE